MPRSIRTPAAALLVALAAACSDDGSPEPSSGGVQGEVHLLGDFTPNPSSGVVQLYASLDAVDRRQPFREAALAGGPVDWTFRLEGVPAGTYYLGACFEFGCGTHSDIEGHPAPVEVVGMETTTAVMAL